MRCRSVGSCPLQSRQGGREEEKNKKQEVMYHAYNNPADYTIIYTIGKALWEEKRYWGKRVWVFLFPNHGHCLDNHGPLLPVWFINLFCRPILRLLGFSVLPSTPEGTLRVPRSGKFVRWALCRCYAGDVTIMKS